MKVAIAFLLFSFVGFAESFLAGTSSPSCLVANNVPATNHPRQAMSTVRLEGSKSRNNDGEDNNRNGKNGKKNSRNNNRSNSNNGKRDNYGMEDYEAARQSFERMIHIDGKTGELRAPGGMSPMRAHLTANEARLRHTELQLLETLRESDAAIDPLVELWVNERQEPAQAIHQMIHHRSPGLVEEEYALRAMIDDYGPDGWVEPHGRLALLLFTRGDYWEAADLCEYVLDVKPWHFEVAQLLVIVQLRLGDYERALQITRRYVLPPLHHPKRRSKWIANMVGIARRRLEHAKQLSEHVLSSRWLDECPDTTDSDCWQ